MDYRPCTGDPAQQTFIMGQSGEVEEIVVSWCPAHSRSIIEKPYRQSDRFLLPGHLGRFILSSLVLRLLYFLPIVRAFWQVTSWFAVP